MINHARSLLVNRPGGAQSLKELGEEYIPPSFQGQKLPPWMQSCWNTIFGSNPDNTYLNYRAEQLLRTIAATEYGPYLRYHDTRETYDPLGDSDFAEVNYALTSSFTSAVTAASIVEVTRRGDLVADETTGTMCPKWNVTVSDGIITVENTRTRESVTKDIFSDGSVLSTPFHLPGSPLDAHIRWSAADTMTDWNTSGRMSALLRPQKSIADITNELDALHVDTVRLFGSLAKEPYLTFYGLWRQNEMPLRLTGFVLALIFRMHELYYGE